MKLTTILCVVLQLNVFAYAQNVTIKMTNRPLVEVLNQIAKQAKINFSYGSDFDAITRPVTISVTNVPFEEAIRVSLAGQALSYKFFDEKTVIIFSTTNPQKEDLVPAISSDTTDVPMEFTGTVMDEKGVLMPGATVRILSLARGTQTDAQGKFLIKGSKRHNDIVVSFTGFKSEMLQGGSKSMMVFLEQAAEQLDRVVVQGYGVTSQRYATGNVATVSAQEIERQPVQNLLQAVQGKVAGLTISQTSGFASAPFKIELRGRSTINPDIPSEPLIIVDGVPLTVINGPTGGSYANGSTGFVQNGFITPAGGQSPLYSIPPDEIESISVLKDADATAIYGSRGGKGVILITTKKGKPGQATVDANVSTGVSFVKNYYEMLSTTEYLAMRREAFKNSGVAPDELNAYDLLVWDTTRQTNWQKVFWGKPARNSEYKLTVSGGDKFNNYRISAGYDRLTSLNSFSGLDERASMMVNTGHKGFDNKLNIELSLLYTFTKNNNIALGGGATLSPNAPDIFDGNGRLNYAGWEPVPYLFSFGTLFQPYVAKTRFINGALKVDYNILKGLKVGVSFGYSNHSMQQHSTVPIISQNPSYNPLGSASFGNNNGTRIIVEPLLEYKRTIWKGLFNVTVGGTYQTVRQDGNTVYGNGYSNDNLLNSIASASSVFATDAKGEYKYVAAFGRISYNVLERYLLTLSGRRDGSSRFGPGNRFGNFGAIGIGWIFTEEDFLRSWKSVLSYGKLRTSFGMTGSDNIGDYNFLSRWTSNNLRYLGVATFYPGAHANPDLQWQSDRKLEVGLNLGFIDDRVIVGLSWYRNRSGNQLIRYTLPSTTGFNRVVANFPATVQNAGWEPEVSAKIIKTSDLEISVRGVIGINRNKLLSFPGLDKSPYASVYEVGKSLNQRKLLILKGVNPDNGKYEFEDIVKDGVTSISPGPTDDRVFKDMTVRYDGGGGLDVIYKGFRFGFGFNFRKGLGVNALYGDGVPGSAANIPRDVLNRWQKPGDRKPFARYSIFSEESDSYFTESTGKYTDASFVRLSNAYISYYLPSQLMRRWGLKSMKVFMRGQNLALFSSYKGSDPEVQLFGSLPPLTSVDGGIQITL